MSEPDESVPAAKSASVRHLLGRNALAMAAAAALTLAFQLAVCLGARSALPPAEAVALAVLAELVWAFLAGAVFACGGLRPIDGLLRAACVADASAITLAVMAIAGPLSVTGAAKLYLILACVVLLEWAVIALARSPGRRLTVGAAAATAAMVLCAAPFWTNGLLLACGPQSRLWASRAVTAVNPVASASRCLTEEIDFVWSEQPVHYEMSVLGRDVPMPRISWSATPLAYGIGAVLLGAGAAWRRRIIPLQP